MKALLFKDARGAVLSEVPVPEPRDGEAVVRVEACGLCGTDLMKLDKGLAGSVLGHEVAGTIARLGRGVKQFKEGDRVALAHHVPCGSCHFCLRGSPSMCRQFKETNIAPGGFCEYALASSLHVKHTLLKLPDALGFVEASQIEPLACCLRNDRRLRLRDGDTAGIVGLGAIGLMTAQLLKRRGIKVLGLDIDDARADALSPWGEGFTEAARLEEAMRRETHGRGLDALVFTAGPADLPAKLLPWLRGGGTLNLFASFHPSIMPLDLNAVYHRELTVMSSYSPALEDLAAALRLIASGKFSVAALKPKTFRLEEFDIARRQLRERKLLKAVFTPR